MVLSSSITITVDSKRLVCSGFSLGELICLVNFEFIADYFGGLSISPRRGNKGAIFVGPTHSRASTPQWATIEDPTEEFLTTSSEEGSFDNPSPRWFITGAPFAPTATATWKENALATTIFPCGRRSRGQKPTTSLSGITLTTKDNRRKPVLGIPPPSLEQCHGKQTTAVVQPDAPPWHEPMLKTERIAMVGVTSTQA
jgi:hypothetical protein